MGLQPLSLAQRPLRISSVCVHLISVIALLTLTACGGGGGGGGNPSGTPGGGVNGDDTIADPRAPNKFAKQDKGTSANPYVIKEKTVYQLYFAATDDQNHYYELTAAADGIYRLNISGLSTELGLRAEILLSSGSTVPCYSDNTAGSDVFCIIENVTRGDKLLIHVQRETSFGVTSSGDFNLEIKLNDNTAITPKFPDQSGAGSGANPFLIAENYKYRRTYLATGNEDHHYEFTASTTGTYSIRLTGMNTNLIMRYELDFPDGTYKLCTSGNNAPRKDVLCDIDLQAGVSYLLHVLRDHTYTVTAGDFDLEVLTPDRASAPIVDNRIGNGTSTVSDPLYIAENLVNSFSINTAAYYVFKATENGDYTISISGVSPVDLKLSWFFEAVDGSYKSYRTGFYGVSWQSCSNGRTICVADNVKAGTDYSLRVEATADSIATSGNFSLYVRSPSGKVIVIPVKIKTVKNDLDGDGVADLLTEINEVRDTGPTTRWQLKRTLGSSFTPIGTEKVSSVSAQAIAMADATNDGRNDLLVQWTENGEVHWKILQNQPDNIFVDYYSLPPIDAGDYPRAVGFADIDNNGYADVVIQYQKDGMNNFRFWMNDGTLLEAPLSDLAFSVLNGHTNLIALEDINGDGKADLVIDQTQNGYHCFSARSYDSQGFTFLWSGCMQSVSDEPIQSFVADVSGDGKSELIVSTGNIMKNTWRVYSAVGGVLTLSLFDDFEIPFAHSITNTVDVTDLNNDGKADLLVSFSASTGTQWYVYTSNGGGFNPEALWLQTSNPDVKALGLADYNADGLPDLLLKADVSDRSLYYVKLNDGSSFSNSSVWTVWHEDFSFPVIVGLTTAGNTSYTTNTKQLLRFMGGSGVGYTPNETKKMVTKEGFVLVEGQTAISDSQCKINYPSYDEKDVSVDIGALVCEHKFGDRVTLTSQPIYGGCDVANAKLQIGGVQCKIGTLSNQLDVEIVDGAKAGFTVEGPAANACASISTEFLCANAGATWADASVGVTDKYGSGIGVGVSAGVGAGISGKVEDGIISGSVDIKAIAGGSVNFSFNYEKTAEDYVTVYNTGRTGFAKTAKGIVAAGSDYANAFSVATGRPEIAAAWANMDEKFVMSIVDATAGPTAYPIIAIVNDSQAPAEGITTEFVSSVTAALADAQAALESAGSAIVGAGESIIQFFNDLIAPPA